MTCILFIIIVSGPLHCITLEDAPHIVAYGNGTPGIVQCTTCVTVYDIPDDQATVGMWKSCFSRWTLGLFLMKRRVPCAVCLVWNISCQQTGGFLIVSKGEAKGKNAHSKSKQQFWVSCKEWLRRRKPPIMGWGGSLQHPIHWALRPPWHPTDVSSMRGRKSRHVHAQSAYQVKW